GGCTGMVSGSATVNVHAPPTATLTGDTTLCEGGSVAFPIQSTGTPPFQIVYALNGNPQAPVLTPLNNFFISTGNVQAPQIFTLLSIQDGLCAGTVSGMATVAVNPAPTGAIRQDVSICAGDSALLTLQLSGGTPYDLTIGGGATLIQLSGVPDGATFSVNPSVTTTYAITNLVATGNTCPAIIGQPVTVTVSNLTATAMVSVFQGYNVSCANEADGSITITPSGGIAPIMASWSNGASGLQISDLSAGDYALTLTDQAGCVFQDSFGLTAPPAVDFAFSTQSPPCFGDIDGGFRLDTLSGGSGPYTYSLNGQASQPVGSLPVSIQPLPAGAYSLSIMDANGCSAEQLFNITPPSQLLVDLGQDVTLNFGDSILLEAEVNSFTVHSFQWTPTTFLQQPTGQATWARPTQTQTYEVQVADTAGCKASDRIVVTVNKTKRVFIPNIINLRSDTYNNVLTIFAGPEVTNVHFLRVYDRWGECVYEGLELPTNDPQFGWSGTFRNKNVQPGVYVYVAELRYFDGSTEVFSGDVTVVN
ncbi:MAG: gliding motility-associated C-terminal domain-containing protein, partial [Saprospiraceae bacterium]